MKLLLSLLLIAGIGSDSISTNLGSIGSRNLNTVSTVIELPGTPRIILDASDTDSLSLSGSNVTSWTASGTNTVYTWVQSSPTYSGSGSTSAVQFNHSSSQWLRSPTNEDKSTANWHIFAVINPSGASDTTAAGYTNNTIYAFAQYGGLRIRNDSGTIRAVASIFDGSHRGVQSSAAVPTGSKIILDASANSSVLSVRVNGGSEATTICGSTTESFGQSSAGGANFANNYDGYIHEIVVYDSVLTGDDYTQAIDYLQAKWEI